MNTGIREYKHADLINLVVLKQQVWVSTYLAEGLTDEFSSYVFNEFKPEKVKQNLSDKGVFVLIAEVNGAMVACAELSLIPEPPAEGEDAGLEIRTLYVLESFHRKGIGKKLLEACEAKTQQLGCKSYWLSVYFKNENAINFYHQQGFRKVGEMDFIIGENGYKNFILKKVLA